MDILDFEQNFQLKKDEIFQTSSVPHRLYLLIEFYKYLEESSRLPNILPYRIEMSEILTDCTNNIPEEFYIPLYTGLYLDTIFNGLVNDMDGRRSEMIRQSYINFINYLIRISLNTGTFETTLNLIEKNRKLEYRNQIKNEELFPEDLKNRVVNENISTQDFIHLIEPFVRSGYETDILDNYKNLINLEDVNRTNVTCFLNVIKNGSANQEYMHGTVDELNLFLREREYDDLINISNFTSAERELIHLTCMDSLEAVRNNFGKKTEKKFFNVHLSIKDKKSVYTGSSIVLAVAALIYSQLTYRFSFKNYFVVKPFTAFTGTVSASGKILSINEKALQSKIENAFYSPVKTIVLPKSNIEAAEKTINRLKEEFPGKSINLIGVSSIKELADNKNIFARIQHEPVKLFTRKAVKIRNIMTPFLLLLIFCFLLGSTNNPIKARIFKDREPVSYKTDKNKITVLNKDGLKLCDFNFNNELSDKHHIIHYSDLNGDGDKEIVFALKFINPPNDTLFCGNLNGDILWKKALGMELKYTDPAYTGDINNIKVYKFYNCEDINNDGLPEIIVQINKEPDFPHILLILDADGSELGYYHNSGGINTVEFEDINDDSTKEVFIGGIFQDTGSPFFTVIELKDMKGAAPVYENSPRQNLNLEPGSQLIYYVFPKTSGTNIVHSYAANIDFINRKIVIRTTENSLNNISGGIYYYFDYQFSLEKILTNTDYDHIWNERKKQNLIKENSIQETKQIIKNSIKFYKDGRWANLPAK